MRKIIINRCYGGFGLSPAALARYNEIAGRDEDCEYWIPRDDAALVQVVEEMGQSAWGQFAELKVVEIPEDVQWGIGEYDGIEYIFEQHKTWS